MSKRVLYIVAVVALMFAACNASTNKSKLTPEEAVEYEDAECVAESEPANGNAEEASRIEVSKASLTLKVYDKNNRLICCFPVAVGSAYGNKQKNGDMKTPEGTFKISGKIQDAASWKSSKGDDNERVAGGYGPWFIRLDVPNINTIGICGTLEPELVGLRSSSGNIVMNNDDLDSLYNMINPHRTNIEVTIIPGERDLRADGKLEEQKESPAEPKREEETKAVTKEEPKEEKPAQKQDSKSSEVVANSDGEVWHKVAKGEYLSTIAQKYNTTVAKIKKLNPDLNPDKIREGQRIKVYGAEEVTSTTDNSKAQNTPTSGEVYHKVAKGEYLSTIASNYGTSINKIKELNPGLNPDRIREGQKIRVR